MVEEKEYTFKVKAVAKGLSSVTTNLTTFRVGCGNEIVSASVDKMDILITKDTLDAPDIVEYDLLPTIFKSDNSDCDVD